MRRQLERIVEKVSDSPTRTAAVILVFAALSALLGYSSHILMMRANTSESDRAMAAAVVAGLAAGCIVLLLLLGVRERHRRMVEDINKIAQLNHEVRNALQAILYGEYLPRSEKQRKAVLVSIDKIDQTLRELFPVIGGRRSGNAPQARTHKGGREQLDESPPASGRQ